MKQYQRPLQEWIAFCSRNGYTAFDPEIHQVLSWLTEKYDDGASYGTISTARSALSLICGKRVRKDPTISRLLRGIFNKRPSKPRYDQIYDLEPVLDKLEEFYPLADLDIARLTEKLVVLLAVITAQRKQTLHSIKMKNIRKTQQGYEIRITDTIKTTRPGAYQPLLVLPRFDSKPKLCAARTLEAYLALTKPIRGGNESLFLTTRRPYTGASRDTISRWIRSFLARCGLQDKFAPHSIRHASTSAAWKKGVDMTVIKSLAGWSERSKTFDRFYNRPIVTSKTAFAEALVA